MSHGRHDYPEAIHLVRVQGRAGDAIFFPAEILREYPEDSREHAPDLRFWESLVARACDRHAAKVHGFTWLPNEAILLLQRFGVPIRIILASLLGQYSRHLHETGRVPPGESPYLSRCKSIEVTPELLPYALRNLYARAVRAGLCTNPLRYPLCSRDLHFAEIAPRWFQTQDFLARVAKRGYVGRASVEQFLAKPEGPRHAKALDRLSSRTPQIAGERLDVEDARWFAEHTPPAPRVQQVADGVAALLRRESKSFDSVLAVALAAWYATRAGAATLNQMGHWFDREPTTLRADIESHRKTSSALFELNVEGILALARSAASLTGALCGSSQPDVDGVPSTPSSAPGPPNAAGRRPDGPSRPPNTSGLASVCMISREDATCVVAQSDSELTATGRRERTWKRRNDN